MLRMRTVGRRLMGFALVVITVLSLLAFWATRPARSAASLPPEQILHDESYAHEPRADLRIVTYNIGYASGETNNRGALLSREEVDTNLEEIAETLRTIDADIIGLQEVDLDSARSYGVNQAEYLAAALEMPYLAYVVTWNLTYLPWPYWPAHHHFGRIVSGQAVLSRYPITQHTVHRFAKPKDNPFWYNWFYLDRVVQGLTVDVGGTPFALWHTHLDAFSNETRLQQAQALGAMIEASSQAQHILLGDLNSTSFVKPGHEYWAEEGPAVVDYFTQQLGFTNVELENDYTFPSWEPIKKIDHVLLRGLPSARAKRPPATSLASDHLPVCVQAPR